jgi:hypothetical protein
MRDLVGVFAELVASEQRYRRTWISRQPVEEVGIDAPSE